MMRTSLNTKGQTVEWHFIFSDDMILYRVSSLCYKCNLSTVQSFLSTTTPDKFKWIHCIQNRLMHRPPIAKPLISVLYMNVSIMWVLRSLTCKLLQICSILRILLIFQSTKMMIMISILKWQANPFLSYIFFSADS